MTDPIPLLPGLLERANAKQQWLSGVADKSCEARNEIRDLSPQLARAYLEQSDTIARLTSEVERKDAALREARRLADSDAEACRAFAAIDEAPSWPERVVKMIDAALNPLPAKEG